MLLTLALAVALFMVDGCSSPVNVLSQAPAGTAPVPTSLQVAYQRKEMLGFLHFGLDTFDGTEHGSPQDSPQLFAPTNLDAAQWVKAFKDAGVGQVTLVAKHSTGFCLWPSQTTTYSVASSPWKAGKGDVVKEFTDAMHAASLAVGIYLSPDDAHFPSTDPGYEAYLRQQVTELLQNYGRVEEIQFDGFQAPTSLDWQGIASLAHQLQPDVLVWMGREIATAGADLRYLGNETGQGARSTSNVGSIPNGGPANVWYPAEAPVTDRQSPTGTSDWFWHAGDTTIALGQLQTIYFGTVGMNATLKLNVPPSQAGLLDAADLSLLRQFGDWRASLYETNLARARPILADSTWGPPGFEASRAVDGDIATYWAAADGTTMASLEVELAPASSFTLISLREPIELGERVTAYHVELLQDGTWNSAPTDAGGTTISGTTIGQRQLWQLGSTRADAVKLVIDSAKAAPAIAELGIY